MSEDFNDWQHRRRVEQERWDYATLAGVAASSLLAHILLTRDRLQEWWHERLAAAWLRSAD